MIEEEDRRKEGGELEHNFEEDRKMMNDYNELLIHIYRSFLVPLEWEFVSIPTAFVTCPRQQEINDDSFY